MKIIQKYHHIKIGRKSLNVFIILYFAYVMLECRPLYTTQLAATR